MAAIKGLVSRVGAEFWASGEKHRKAQAEQVQAYQERQKRPRQLGRVFDRLRDVRGPRLEVLVKKFGGRVQVAPRVAPSTREVKFQSLHDNEPHLKDEMVEGPVAGVRFPRFASEFGSTAWVIRQIEAEGLAISPQTSTFSGGARPAPVDRPSLLPDRMGPTPEPGERKEAP
jgi:hypothetical protein